MSRKFQNHWPARRTARCYHFLPGDLLRHALRIILREVFRDMTRRPKAGVGSRKLTTGNSGGASRPSACSSVS